MGEAIKAAPPSPVAAAGPAAAETAAIALSHPSVAASVHLIQFTRQFDGYHYGRVHNDCPYIHPHFETHEYKHTHTDTQNEDTPTYTHAHTHTHTYIYIYLYRERDINRYNYIYMYTYI